MPCRDDTNKIDWMLASIKDTTPVRMANLVKKEGGTIVYQKDGSISSEYSLFMPVNLSQS